MARWRVTVVMDIPYRYVNKETQPNTIHDPIDDCYRSDSLKDIAYMAKNLIRHICNPIIEKVECVEER